VQRLFISRHNIITSTGTNHKTSVRVLKIDVNTISKNKGYKFAFKNWYQRCQLPYSYFESFFILGTAAMENWYSPMIPNISQVILIIASSGGHFASPLNAI